MGQHNIRAGLRAVLDGLRTQLNELQADVAARRTSFNDHTHGGSTAGAANSGAGPAAITISAGTLNFNRATPRNLLLDELASEITKLAADIGTFDTAFNAHTHGGVTAGSDPTSAAPTISALTSAALPAQAEIKLSQEQFLELLYEQFNAIRADLATINTALGAHVHGGNTAGGGTTAAGPSASAATSSSASIVS